MKISPTEAKKYITVSQDTLYKAMKRGDLSYDETERGRKIEFSELQRWHENAHGPLKSESGQTSESIRSDISSPDRQISAAPDGAVAEIALLRMRLEMLEQERKREREQWQEQIERLDESLKSAQEHQTRLTALLTDQRQESERKEAKEQAGIIRELRQRQIRLERELRERERSIFARWFGAGQGRGKRGTKPARRPASQEAGA